jgi:uncharacterized protein
VKSNLDILLAPWYDKKDVVHGIDHIRRVLAAARRLAAHYDGADMEVLCAGAYLHGIPSDERAQVGHLLRSMMPEAKISAALTAAAESQKDSEPVSLEGKILHDAHLIEGGRTFLIVKSLVAGSARGQTVEETISFIEENILGRFKCYLPEASGLYAEKEAYAREFLRELREGLRSDAM